MLGLDALVSVANVFYLMSYSVRDILWLRILTVVGGTLLLPYYYLQTEPLWAPFGWNLVFLAINVFWIAGRCPSPTRNGGSTSLPSET